MKVYTHDYTKAAEAEELVHKALTHLSEDDPQSILLEAQTLLREYLSEDNAVEDSEAEGFIRLQDTFDKEQIRYIRGVFRELSTHRNNRGGELDIVNKCQRLLGFPQYASLGQIRKEDANEQKDFKKVWVLFEEKDGKEEIVNVFAEEDFCKELSSYYGSHYPKLKFSYRALDLVERKNTSNDKS